MKPVTVRWKTVQSHLFQNPGAEARRLSWQEGAHLYYNHRIWATKVHQNKKGEWYDEVYYPIRMFKGELVDDRDATDWVLTK